MVKHIKQNKEVVSFITLFVMLCSLTGLMLHFQVEKGTPSSVVYAASGNPTPTPTPTLSPLCQQILSNLNAKVNVAETLLADIQEVNAQVNST